MRADHIHNIPTAAPITTLSATTTNSQGSASTFSQSDHSHAITTGTPSTQNADQTNAPGVSANLARADHIHNIPTAVPSSIGSANSQGVSTLFVKADHVHQGLHSINANGGSQRYGDQTLQQGAGINIVDNGTGVFAFSTTNGANELLVSIGSGLSATYTGGRININGTITNISRDPFPDGLHI